MNIIYDYKFAKSLGEKRIIDQIVMVADSLPEMTRNLETVFGFTGFTTGENEYGKTASVVLSNGIELFIIEPSDAQSAYRTYFDAYGKGIMGIRERITLGAAGLWRTHIEKEEIPVIKQQKDFWWMDLRKDLGCMYGLYICEEPLPESTCSKHIGQICITAFDAEKAAADLLHYIGKGPWEIGFINSHTSDYFISSEFDAKHFPDAEMRTGMGWFSNLEFEIIEPTKGPMPYYKFLARHGNGFQHFKEILTPETFDETLKAYADKGVGTALAGKLGPCAFSNLDTEDLIGCVYELSDGHVMDKLPDGYNAYMYPEKLDLAV